MRQPCRAPLGDRVAAALASVGITPARVERWLGRACGCVERRAALNALEAWAARALAGRSRDVAADLRAVAGEIPN